MGTDLQFLRESEIFKGLPDTLLQKIFQRGSLKLYGPGEEIFAEGSHDFDMYVIRQGVVEIRKAKLGGEAPAVVAYLTAGECFGEMALITGRPRSATARVPEEAEILRIPAEVYEEQMLGNVLFLRRLCELLAYRLEHADVKIAAGAGGKELRGSLQYFDVATVMQTLINSGQSGVMVIETPDRVQAEVVFEQGKILYAKMQDLEGEDAFYQIFQDELSGEFVFRGEDVDPAAIPCPIGKNPMNLLLEAMRMKDELKVFLTEIEDFDLVFKPRKKILVWKDAETLDTALLIWMKLREGMTLGRLLKDVARCSYTVLAIIRKMREDGMVE
jgi:CRP-like cAMP-binding protein